MNEQEFNKWLDKRTHELPRSIEPQSDLWPGIRERLDETDVSNTYSDSRFAKVWPFAAGMAATALVAMMTVQIMRHDNNRTQTAPVVDATRAPSELPEVLTVEPLWVPEVRRASNDLKADYEASLDNLSPETRAIVEENLAQIHDSLAKIQEALDTDPNNAALHRLLAGTYQQEVSLFSSIGALNKAEVEL